MSYVTAFNKIILSCFFLNLFLFLIHKNISFYCIFRSNLAAIFGLHSKPADSTKQTAFKKNNTRYNIQQTVPSSKTEILIAKAVHAFKL